MKILIIFLSLILFAGFFGQVAAQSPRFDITCRMENAEGVQFTFQRFVGGQYVNLDTATVKNGSFTLSGGWLEFPELVALVTLDRQKGFSFFLENSPVSITADFNLLPNATVRGSKSNDEYNLLISKVRPLNETMMKLNNQFKAITDSLQASQNDQNKPEIAMKVNQLTADYRATTSVVGAEMIKARTDFVRNNPGSFVNPIILSSLFKELKATEMDELIRVMKPEVARSPMVAAIKADIDARKATEPGQKAPDFTLNDPDGKPVPLSSKIGAKLLLVDFWAGWCGPCRRENPNVVRVYNEFHSKGFDVLGVSLDREKETWLSAIKADNLAWTQVSDLSYFNCAAARLYNVNSIPSNFLLDEKGIIVAVNLRGEDLYLKVKELIGSQ